MVIRQFSVLSIVTGLSACAPSFPHHDHIFITNERGNDVVALDVASGTLGMRINPGVRPRGLLLSADGSTLYVAVSGSPIGGPGVDEGKLPPPDHKLDGIAVIDVASGKVQRTIPAGTDPETFALSPDGRTLFVSNEDRGAVSAVALDGGRETTTTKIGEEPEGIAVTPDGARLFVACEASDHVAMLDARTLKLLRTIPIAGRPRGVLMSSDSSRVFVSVESGGRVAMISALDGTLQTQVDLAHGDPTLKPMGMVESPDGHLFITTGRGGSVIEVDPKSRTIVRRIDHVGGRPWGIGITADRRFLVTANGSSNDVSIIDRASGKVIRKISAGQGPWGIAGAGGGGAQ